MPCEPMRQLQAVLIHWSPGRLYPDAQLYEPAPEVAGKRPAHRPRKKGKKLSTPQEAVATTGRTALDVACYGGGSRDVVVVSGSGHWLKWDKGLVPVRWASVHDVTGTHRDNYFFSTDAESDPKSIVETFTGRWSIETTFQEMRLYLGPETTRGRTEPTVLRLAPCLFGLYSMVALLYERLRSRGRATARVGWAGKVGTTFSDATTTVRRWLWSDWVFAHQGY
jgi:hypothetical protein